VSGGDLQGQCFERALAPMATEALGGSLGHKDMGKGGGGVLLLLFARIS
jgi:hypothetical protein